MENEGQPKQPQSEFPKNEEVNPVVPEVNTEVQGDSEVEGASVVTGSTNSEIFTDSKGLVHSTLDEAQQADEGYRD